jgi:hypothetical protein
MDAIIFLRSGYPFLKAFDQYLLCCYTVCYYIGENNCLYQDGVSEVKNERFCTALRL